MIYNIFILFISFQILYYCKSIYHSKSYENIFKLNTKIDTLIIGDSHMRSALDPEIIKNSKNIALDTENYLCTYYKLKKFVSFNSHIRKVILGFSTHNVSKNQSEALFFQEPTEKQIFKRYYQLLDFEGKKRIVRLFSKYFIISFFKYDLGIPIRVYKDDYFLKNLFNRKIIESDFKFIGGYYRSEKSNVNMEDIPMKIKDYYYNDQMVYAGESELNIEYLNKILDLCSKNGIKVYLYSTPVYSRYKEMIPYENILGFEDVKNKLLKKYENVEYIDHTDYILEKNHFGDQDHVNAFGAKVVSQIIRDKIHKKVYEN